jgi:ArsR family transcriptional regulator, arsenate/arsenite/antimonite-responsive transcriptional repressor
MQKSVALQVFEALSSGVRLDVFRLLVRAGRAGKVAGEIAETLDIAPSNLSFHLKGLTQCGLLTAEQEGRYQRYRANLPLMLETIAFLTENCCGDRPDECADLRRGVPAAVPFLPALERSPEGP